MGYFGLTTDRLYATALMGWIAVVSVAPALTVLRGRARPFAAIAVLSGFAALGALNIGNPELIIARGNPSRTPDTRGIDYEYLTRLSGDAAPAVVHAPARRGAVGACARGRGSCASAGCASRTRRGTRGAPGAWGGRARNAGGRGGAIACGSRGREEHGVPGQRARVSWALNPCCRCRWHGARSRRRGCAATRRVCAAAAPPLT
ncbi:MAG: DUF4173 domain-containing protein [Gemmatimonadetes bacterium]|nr:DUF4173 domain-containing protein [Gemmatimonadota bacterium]